MDVRNCRGCGRLYNYIGGSYRNLCPDCVRKLEEKFDIVKDYIEENKVITEINRQAIVNRNVIKV